MILCKKFSCIVILVGLNGSIVLFAQLCGGGNY